jgi:hypothetical protein
VHRTSRETALFFTTLLAAAPFMLTQSHAVDVGWTGGDGGAPFRSECIKRGGGVVLVPGDAVIGFNMRTGTGLDAIVPICIRVNDVGTEWVGEALRANTMGWR